MSIEKFKDVKIGEDTYRIGRFQALLGAWIGDMVLTGSAQMGVENFNRVQDYCLSVCAVYRTVPPNNEMIPQSIYSREQRKWIVKDLDIEYDLELLDALKTQVLDFNFTDVFLKRAAQMKELTEKAEARKKAEEAQSSTTNQSLSRAE